MAKAQTQETPATNEEKLAAVKAFIEEAKGQEHPDSYLIAVLHRTQELYGYLPTEVMDEIAQEMQIPTAHIWGVATFYHYCLLYTSPSPRDLSTSRMPSSA